MCHNISMEQIIREHFGTHVSVIEVTPLSGGDINRAYTLTLSSGKTVFIKANSLRNVDFFRAETEALSAIAATGTIQTPAIIFFEQKRKLYLPLPLRGQYKLLPS